MPAKTGQQYTNRIDRAHAKIIMGGKRIKGKISEHPAFKELMKSQSKLYDLQHDPSIRDRMTYQSPSSEERVGLSYMIPRTKGDLEKRRLMIREWALNSLGMLGRSPDYMNTVTMAFGSAPQAFGPYAENVKKYYEYCRENDVTLTHTFINPQVNRSDVYFETEEKPIAARIIGKNDEGIVIQGARLLATQGATTDEILVFPSGKHWNFKGENPYAYAFSIPNNTKGLTFICRESLMDSDSRFNRPLSSRYEEVDTLVVFDNVTVPWDRVFVAGDAKYANSIFKDIYFTQHAVHQVITRQIVKTETLLGVIDRLVEMIEIGGHQHVQEKLSEVAVALEVMKGLQLSAETNAELNQWGVMTPDKKPILAAMNYYPRIYPRMVEILQTLGASGMVMLPAEADFQNEDVKKQLDLYMKAAHANAEDRVKLFRLAWDLCMSGFGTRETQYERYFFGDPVRLSGRIYNEYDRKEYAKRINEFLDLNKDSIQDRDS